MAGHSLKDHSKGVLTYIAKFLSVGVFLWDLYSDYYLGYTYALNRDTWYAALTLTFALFPSLINSVWTAYTYYTRDYPDRLIAYPVVIYPLCFCLQGQLAGSLIWLCHAWTDYPLYQSNYMDQIKFSCIGITVYIEVALESLPQLCLQLYVVIIRGYWTNLQLLSITGSILGAGLGLSTLVRRFTSQILACIVNTMWVICRAISIAMIESVKQYVGFAVISAHYLFVCLLCFCDSNRRDVVEKIMASAMSMHNIYTPLLHPHMLTLSIVTAIEIIFCSVFGFLYGQVSPSPGQIKSASSNLTSNFGSPPVSVYNGSLSNMSLSIGNQSVIVSPAAIMPFQDWKYSSAVFGLTIASSFVALLFSFCGKCGGQRGNYHFIGWTEYSLDQPSEWELFPLDPKAKNKARPDPIRARLLSNPDLSI